MNQDDYQKKIDEHRQSIGQDDDSNEMRRSRSSNKKPKKKSRNLLIPTVFCIFILIPVSIFIYVQFFYEADPDKAEVVKNDTIHVETQTINNGTEKEDTPKEEADVKEEVETPVVTTPKETEQSVKEPKEEVTEEPKKEPTPVEKTEPTDVAGSKTHIVKENETLYRIAVNYYNDPSAVEKIKSANGLTSNEIAVGQKLVLP
ncbi:LysM peptidoglycan-binding domain-containing protein [Psychrobacillus sp. INOP01]|uniref:LysM peptidoglycan-binding domain-containing protein n=1 Tax=Psychrobacillus sp. INOP01 TaxID=2829187 RepID=UPI001BA5CEB1|nr:LysM peptidoglycan-binding domain-containing protein [Psychrobacillus sp. INOP01]QUG41390.1 LysM peptidoglycan-binding domain-containing protein [Psychrobacillus sp. INOP01]